MGYEAVSCILRRARLLIDTAVKEQHVDTYTQLAAAIVPKGGLEGGERDRVKLFHSTLERLNDNNNFESPCHHFLNSIFISLEIEFLS